jgi:tetratricopeptide (TPR) repeat protein
MFEETLTIYRGIGDVSGVARIQSNLGIVHSMRGDLDEAMAQWGNALATYRQLNHKEGIARTLTNLGNGLLRRGDPAGAEQRLEEALVLYRELGRRRDSAVALDSLAALRLGRGDLVNARRLNEEALSIYESVGDKAHVASELGKIATVLRAQGDLDGARRRQEQALAVQEEIGEKTAAALTRTGLAKTALEQRRGAEAEALMRKAIEEYRTQKLSSDEAWGQALLAEILLFQRKLPDARAAIQRATELLGNSKSRRTRLDVDIAGARVLAASGRFADAGRRLHAAIAEARQLHILDRELDSRLTLGEVELLSGNGAAGRERLAGVRKEAAAKGFALLARKAAGPHPSW